jgi:signal transduction histidine kinase
MGIGLSVARGMTEAMGGRIDAQPSPLGGLRIRMRLPVAMLADGMVGER